MIWIEVGVLPSEVEEDKTDKQRKSKAHPHRDNTEQHPAEMGQRGGKHGRPQSKNRGGLSIQSRSGGRLLRESFQHSQNQHKPTEEDREIIARPRDHHYKHRGNDPSKDRPPDFLPDDPSVRGNP